MCYQNLRRAAQIEQLEKNLHLFPTPRNGDQ
jgi:hypothetical protein